MANDLFVPRADLVDDAFWIETPETIEVSTTLWRLLAVTREDPPRWVPPVVLCGESGVGKAALAQRFVKATRRSVACDLVDRTLARLDIGQVRRDQEARDQAAPRRHAWSRASLRRPERRDPEAAGAGLGKVRALTSSGARP